jgi:hypothetical protein
MYIHSIALWKSGPWIVRLLTVVCVVHSLLAILRKTFIYLNDRAMKLKTPYYTVGAFSIETIWDAQQNICIILPGKTQHGLLSLYCFSMSDPFLYLVFGHSQVQPLILTLICLAISFCSACLGLCYPHLDCNRHSTLDTSMGFSSLSHAIPSKHWVRHRHVYYMHTYGGEFMLHLSHLRTGYR